MITLFFIIYLSVGLILTVMFLRMSGGYDPIDDFGASVLSVILWPIGIIIFGLDTLFDKLGNKK